MRIPKGEKAFTLIELIIIIVIFGVLFAIAIPKYLELSAKVKAATVYAFTQTLRSAATITYANVALGNITGSTTGNIDITSAYNNLEETGGIVISGTDFFTAVIDGQNYRWQYTAPMSITDGEPY